MKPKHKMRQFAEKRRDLSLFCPNCGFQGKIPTLRDAALCPKCKMAWNLLHHDQHILQRFKFLYIDKQGEMTLTNAPETF